MIDARSRTWRALVAAAMLAAVSGCSGPTEEQLLASARKHLDQSAPREAIIELKGVLQKNQHSGAARLLLGQALLRVGDPQGAALELAKALDAGAERDDVMPLLARTQLQLFKFKEIVEQHAALELKDPVAAADLKGTVAAAHLYMGDKARAQAAAEAAVKLDPKTEGARLVLARMQAARGEYQQALASANAVLQDVPGSTDATQLQGDLYWFALGDAAKATGAYEATLKRDPRHLAAHSALTMLALVQNDVPQFRKRVADMKVVFPKAMDTRVHEVEVALLDKDMKQAREGVQQLLRVAPDNDRILQLAGVIELSSGNPAQALTHLQKALTKNPGLRLSRALLAESHLRVGNTDKALAVLEPLVAAPDAPLQALQLAAEAHLQKGDLDGAEQMFAAAAKIKPDDASVGTALAMSMIARGRAEAGFARLAELSKASASPTADLALISARLRRGQSAEALKAVEDLQSKQPDKALPWLLKGRILAGQRDTAGARQSLEQALKLEPRYFPAAVELAALETSASTPDAAVRRYESFLAGDPGNPNAMMALAFEKKRRGAPADEVTKLLQDAIRAGADQSGPRLALVEHYLSLSKIDDAVATAQDAVAHFPNDLDAIDSLGRAQMAKGDLQQAMSAFGKVAAARPQSALAQLRLAEVERKKGSLDSALGRISTALQLAPDMGQAQAMLLTIALRDKKFEGALTVARDVQKRHPKRPAGFALEGAIHSARKQWPQAIESFEAALARGPSSTDVALRLHGIYLAAGKTPEAQRLATRWESAHPKDAAFLSHLGMLALSDKDFPRAESKFRAALTAAPNDPRIMNNLAWTLLQLGKPGALPLAERANEMVPNTALFMDTLASALAEAKQTPRALELQRKVVQLSPDDYQARLNLARILISAGDKTAARAELQKLSGLGAGFAGQREVETLLKSL